MIWGCTLTSALLHTQYTNALAEIADLKAQLTVKGNAVESLAYSERKLRTELEYRHKTCVADLEGQMYATCDTHPQSLASSFLFQLIAACVQSERLREAKQVLSDDLKTKELSRAAEVFLPPTDVLLSSLHGMAWSFRCILVKD
eukprot:scaffold3396_cov385-Prasinococcus_capsulatus_cf.AAC.5